MNITSSSLDYDSAYLRGRTHLTGWFHDATRAEAAIQALHSAGFAAGEVRREELDGGSLVTVGNSQRLPDIAAILQHHGGRLPDGGPTSADARAEAAADVAQADADDAATPSTPTDAGLSVTTEGKRVGGSTFTSGSIAGGSGAGTATGGSLFGSSR